MASIKVLGRVISGISVTLGSLLSYGFVLNKCGFFLGIIATMIFPVTVAAAPWYEGFALGNWLPIGLVYGGAITFNLFSDPY